MIPELESVHTVAAFGNAEKRFAIPALDAGRKDVPRLDPRHPRPVRELGKTPDPGGNDLFESTKLFAILEALLTQPGKVLTRERIEELLYGWDEGVESNAIEVYIHHLRKKLGKELIRTMRGVGYLVPTEPGDG